MSLEVTGCAIGAIVIPTYKRVVRGLRVLSFAAATLSCACDAKLTRRVSAEILSVEGGSWVLKRKGNVVPPPGTTKWIAGEELRTDPNCTISVALLPGALLRLEPRSHLALTELALGKKGLARTMHRRLGLRLVEGAIFTVVEFEGGAGDWLVETPEGSISTIAPGLCRIEVGEQRTRLTCVRGEFTFTRTTGHATRVAAGYFGEWSASGTDQAASAAELDERAQDNVEKCLSVERKLLNKQNDQRFAPFQWRQF